MPDLLVTSLSGLRAYQTALATTSHNIANVGNEAYTRQRVELDARVPIRYGSSFIGQGVDVTNIQRIFDNFIIENLRQFTSSTSSLGTLQELATRVENITADENSGLTSAMDHFFGALSDVANNPSASAPRIALLGSAEILEQRFNALGEALRDIDKEVDARIRYQITDINALTSEIARVNSAISAVSSVDEQPNDLLDKRDALLKQLSEKISITVITQNDGTLNVLAGSGQLLVSGPVTNTLVAQGSASQPDRTVVALQSTGGGGAVDITSSLNGGELGGLLDFRNNLLDSVQNRLGRTAIALSETFNAQHVQGYDLNGDMGTNFFRTVGTGNLSGAFGGDYLANGANVGDTLTFDLQFDGRTVTVAHTIVAGDTNATIAAGLLTGAAGIAADGNVTNLGGGVYSLAGTTPGISMTFELRGDQIQFTTTGGPSPLGNNLVITNVADGVANDAVINLGLLGSSSTQFNFGAASNGSPAMFMGPSNSTLSNANNTGTGVVNFSITDVSQLTVSDYRVSYDGANYNVLRLSDNVTVASGAGPFNVDGMAITPGGVPAAGDSFYLRPTRLGATSFSVEISDIRDIAAATPIRTLNAAANIGTVGAASSSVVDALDPDLTRTVDIFFDPANPAGSFDVVDRASGTVLQNNVIYTPGMSVTQNGWQVRLTGSPQPGDTVTVTENTNSTNDNRNMLLLAALQNTAVMDNGVTTFEQSYATLNAEVGVVTQQAKINYDVEKTLLDNAIASRESLSGVNLDEEAADLIRFQQAYQALARIIQTSQTLFESLISAV
ncbi:MAG: flagellar hook-associated protein FlgK [Gammaproteobacteria bacterium]|nr:flagellar hook-associated protein FlgK [Gammaproteobacteria bacterium]